MKNNLLGLFKATLIIVFMSNTLFAVHVFEESNFQGADDKKLAELIKSNPKAVTRHLYGIPYKPFGYFSSPQESSRDIIIWAVKNGRYDALGEIFEIAKNPAKDVIPKNIPLKSIADILKYQQPSTGNTALHYAASDAIDAKKKTDSLLEQIPEYEKFFFINEIKNKLGKSVLDVATKYSKPSLKKIAAKPEAESEQEPEEKAKKKSVFDDMKIPLEKKLTTPKKFKDIKKRKRPTRLSLEERKKNKEASLQAEKEKQEALEKGYLEKKNLLDQKFDEFKKLRVQRIKLQKEIDALGFEVGSSSKNKTTKMVKAIGLDTKIKDLRNEITAFSKELEIEPPAGLENNFDEIPEEKLEVKPEENPEMKPEVKLEEDMNIKSKLNSLNSGLNALKVKLQELQKSLKHLQEAF